MNVTTVGNTQNTVGKTQNTNGDLDIAAITPFDPMDPNTWEMPAENQIDAESLIDIIDIGVDTIEEVLALVDLLKPAEEAEEAEEVEAEHSPVDALQNAIDGLIESHGEENVTRDDVKDLVDVFLGDKTEGGDGGGNFITNMFGKIAHGVGTFLGTIANDGFDGFKDALEQ